MNPNAQEYRVRPCIVCGYKFSDEHHIHPEVMGREKSPTIILCPNHHRLAHIVQGMVTKNQSLNWILNFAEAEFDAAFNSVGLPLLLSTYNDLIKEYKKKLPFPGSFGDAVLIRAGYNVVLSKYDGYWGIITHIGTWNYTVHISVKGVGVQCKPDEMNP